MARPTIIPWHELVSLMAVGDGRVRTIAGLISERDVSEVDDAVTGPDIVTMPDIGRVRVTDRRHRAWKRGALVRREDALGNLRLIVGADTTWVWHDESGVPTAYGTRTSSWLSRDFELLDRRPIEDWQGDDFTHPTGDAVAVEFLGRPAWQFELAPPAHKPFPMTMIVDAQTGLVLSEANERFGTWLRWDELVLDEVLDDDLFVWRGPATAKADRDAEQAQDLAEREAWLAERSVTPIVIPVDVIAMLHELADDGAFHVSLRARIEGSLLRRPCRGGPWDEDLRWQHLVQWSDDRWDWLLGTSAAIGDAELAALKQQLSRTT